MPKTYLFHGPSGSGKDTQVEKLIEKGEFERISTGEMMRTMFEEGDSDAVQAQRIANLGKFPGPELTYRLLDRWLDRFDKTKDWILVSVARYVQQIPFLDEALKIEGRKIDKVIHFTIPLEIAIERRYGRKTCPKCQASYHPKFRPEKVEDICDICKVGLETREDNTPEITKSLYSEYNKTIKEYLAEYASRGVLVNIDASPSIKKVHDEVIRALET